MEEAPHEEGTRPGSGESGGLEAAVTSLLLDLGQALHWAAVPSDLVERRVRAAARGLGAQAQVFVLQGFLIVESGQGERRRVDLRRISFDTHWNLRRLHELVELSASLARGECGVAAGKAELERILHQPIAYARWLIVLAYGVNGGAVAARVGGGVIEMIAGTAIGVLAGLIHFGTIRYQRVDLQKSFLAAFFGSLAAFLLTLVLPPFAVGRAVFGGIALLVPAMVITVATHELANDALESGVVRLAYGLLRFLMLAFGITAAVKIWTLLAQREPLVSATPLPWLLVLAIVAVGGVALVFCLQGRRRDLPWIIGAAVLAFGTQELTKVLFGGRGSPLLAALVLGVAAHLQARLPGHVPATVLVPGLLQLAPGFLGSEAVVNLLGGGATGAEPARFFDVFMVALQLVTGLVLADVLVGRRTEAVIEGELPTRH